MSIRKEMKDKLEESFFEILKIVPFEKVTVTEIIRRSNVSHQTFYRYYIDKYDFALQLSIEKLSAFSLIYGEDPTWKEIVIAILYSIKSHSVFFKKLIKDYEGFNIVEKSIVAISKNFTGKEMSTYGSSVFMNVFNHWAKGDFKTPVEDVYRQIIENWPVCEIILSDELNSFLSVYENNRISSFIEKAKNTE